MQLSVGYLDDIIIYSRSEKEHLEIFTRLKAAGLKLKLEKCCFFKKHIQYLGHLISADGIQPLPEKLKSIAKMPAPRNPKEVKQFLRLVGYYRKFVPRFADISRVLTISYLLFFVKFTNFLCHGYFLNISVVYFGDMTMIVFDLYLVLSQKSYYAKSPCILVGMLLMCGPL